MLEIKGEFVREERVKVPCPQDGVHRSGAEGDIKGSHCFIINGKMVCHGMVSFFYILNDTWGLKVYCNPKRGYVTAKHRVVRQIRDRMRRYCKKGLAPKPGKIREVKVDITRKSKNQRLKKHVFALEVERCHWPEKAWRDYSNGNPYDWNACDHKDHSPEGFLKFKNKVNKVLSKEDKRKFRKVGDSCKLGDVVWCNKKERWFLVDMG